MFAVLPLWSMYISLSAAYRGDTIIIAINSFNFFIYIPISSGCSWRRRHGRRVGDKPVALGDGGAVSGARERAHRLEGLQWLGGRVPRVRMDVIQDGDDGGDVERARADGRVCSDDAGEEGDEAKALLRSPWTMKGGLLSCVDTEERGEHRGVGSACAAAPDRSRRSSRRPRRALLRG